MDVLTAPKLERRNGHYHVEDGDFNAVLPSVTTILQVINKPFLLGWYGKHGTAECTRIKQESADFGKTCHDIIEQLVLGKDVDLTQADPLIQSIVTSLQEWMRLVNFTLVGLPEQTIYSKVHGYAGTLDCIALIYGVPTLIDWKTSSDVYPEYTLQVAAYHEAVREMGLATPSIGLIVRMDKKTARVHPQAVPLGGAAFEAFLSAKALWTWLQGAESPATEWRKRAKE